MAQGVSGSLRIRIFLTFRHYKGSRSSAKHTGRLYPRRNPWYSLSEAVSASGHMVLSGEPRKKSPVTPRGIDPGTVRLVAQRLNHCATPGSYHIDNSHEKRCEFKSVQTFIRYWIKWCWHATKVWSLWKYTVRRSSLFCDVRQHRMVVRHRRFESIIGHIFEESSSPSGMLAPWRWDRYVVPKRR